MGSFGLDAEQHRLVGAGQRGAAEPHIRLDANPKMFQQLRQQDGFSFRELVWLIRRPQGEQRLPRCPCRIRAFQVPHRPVAQLADIAARFRQERGREKRGCRQAPGAAGIAANPPAVGVEFVGHAVDQRRQLASCCFLLEDISRTVGFDLYRW